nr:MAG TPA: zinc-ribbon domain protein [Caudoviricetes sp.]
MAAPRRSKQAVAEVKYRCRDCANSYDWHSKAIDGHLILCRCPYKQQGGKFCVFLSDPQCGHFKLRTDNDKEAR